MKLLLLGEEVCRFSFFQVIRLLEKYFPKRERIGRTSHPSREVARLTASHFLRFPASEVQSIENGQAEGQPPKVTVNFMGLTGPLGILPRHYSELVIERLARQDPTFRDFLDIFNHRIVSLFYRAWEKYRHYATYGKDADDQMSLYLSAFAGVATAGLQKRQAIPDRGLFFYAGLIAQHPHSAIALEGILHDYFSVPVRVSQFVGRWINVGDENLTSLGRRNCTLGTTALCGQRTWDRASKFRVCIGPVGYSRFCEFLPSGNAFGELCQLSRFYSGVEHDFDVQIKLQAKEVPRFRLGTGEGPGTRLGWSSWLKVREFPEDASDTVVSPIR